MKVLEKELAREHKGFLEQSGCLEKALEVLHAINLVSFSRLASDYNVEIITWNGFRAFKLFQEKVVQGGEEMLNSQVPQSEDDSYSKILMKRLIYFFTSEAQFISSKDLKAFEKEVKVLWQQIGDHETQQAQSYQKTLEFVLIHLGFAKRVGDKGQESQEEKISEEDEDMEVTKGIKWKVNSEEENFKAIFVQGEQSAQNEKNFILQVRKETQLKKLQAPSRSQVTEAQGFALLKGLNWSYVMQTTICIIGAKPTLTQAHLSHRNPEVHIWEVHLDLGHLQKVSRQHAAIAYNYEEKSFDLICLSGDYSIKVTSFTKQTFREVTCADEPLKL